jgi:tetratricopeptide (TPR) repeat protein
VRSALSDDSMDIDTALALVRASRFDANVLYRTRKVISKRKDQIPNSLMYDVLDAIQKCWSNYFELQTDHDIPYDFGLCLYELKRFEAALVFFNLSEQQHGEHHLTTFNKGLCAYHMGNEQDSLKLFQQWYLVADFELCVCVCVCYCLCANILTTV